MDNKIERKQTLGEVKATINKKIERVRDAQKTVVVYGTGKSQHLPLGAKKTASIKSAKRLVEAGKASMTKPEAKAEEPKAEAKAEEPKPKK